MSSVSFDRAAEFYDRTRPTDDGSVGPSLDLLQAELADRTPILEIGVGTGAIASPLRHRGVPVIGMDLSPAMLGKLREKDPSLPVVVADATRLPFHDAVLGGAYARWVLHLIADWRGVVAELCRVVRPGGVVLIEPGGYGGGWRRLWSRFVIELGDAARPVGLDASDGPDDLDEAFERHGATPRPLPTLPLRLPGRSLETFFEQVRARAFSWTWKASDAELARAVEVVTAWARDRFGDLSAPFEPEGSVSWRAYDLAPPPHTV